MRRFGLLPGGMPDGLGQDAQLLGTTLEQTVMVYFADTAEALYQIEQWYPTFRELNKTHPIIIVLRDSRTTRAVRERSGLPAITIAHYTTMDDLLSRSKLKLALYVNHNPENFSNLRFGDLIHVSLMHGDSDKTVTVSNQTKAYDFSFVAGQAAVDRMAAYSTLYDAATRCIPVGRPQIDEQTQQRMEAEAAHRSSLPTVLYAPTWEGAQPSAAYGSIESHGTAMVQRLLESGEFRVIYRPHPLTGVRVPGYGDADARVRELIAEANEKQSAVHHRIDTDINIAVSFAASDIMICDISGVAMDWLPSDKPLLTTKPAEPEAIVARTPLTDIVPTIGESNVSNIVDMVTSQLADDTLKQARRDLTEYYLGDISPGASARRFLEACDRLISLRDDEMARIAHNRANPKGPHLNNDND